MKEVTIWTDGACSGNPGPGGWGAILDYRGQRREISGGEKHTTHNRIELTAAIRALSLLKEPCRVTLYSDSRYLVDAMTKGWAKSWRARGWVKPDKQPAKNPELYEELLRLSEMHDITFVWVRGHVSNPENNRCDALAVAARERIAE